MQNSSTTQAREIVRTNISPLYWRSPQNDNTTKTDEAIVPAFLSEADLPAPAVNQPSDSAHLRPSESLESIPPLCWLDRLLCGGIVVPPQLEHNRALIVLFSGPPGTCKSTLATELSYRLALQGKKCVYVSSESPEEWLVNNASTFGWTPQRFKPLGNNIAAGVVSVVSVAQTGSLEDTAQGMPQHVSVFDRISKKLPLIRELIREPAETPDLLVLDSLDIKEPSERDRFFSVISEATSTGARILVIVIDAPHTGATAGASDFVADLILRFTRTYDNDSGYMLRHLEILKARYQTHVLGRHQLKVYPQPQKPLTGSRGREDLEREMRNHPYLQQGGIFIFPSVHYLSSVYKRLDPYERAHEIPSVLSSDWPKDRSINMNPPTGENVSAEGRPGGIERLFSGYPRGRSTALLGSRGTYKSHLGYIEILGRVLDDERSRGLVVCLRDDEGVTRRTLAQILATDHHFSHLQDYHDEEERVVRGRRRLQLEESGRVEIMYFPPGYITSEEFLHRLLITVARLKSEIAFRDDEPRPPGISLLFNSFDQLPSRFPLCARESMLIPAIVQMLDSENVTSFFVAARSQGQAEGLYGLESTADLILEVDRDSYPIETYLNSIANIVGVTTMTERLEQTLPQDGLGRLSQATVRQALGHSRRIVTLDVVRYPGCEAMGRRGFLELVSEHDPALFELYDRKRGLHFVPDAPQPTQ